MMNVICNPNNTERSLFRTSNLKERVIRQLTIRDVQKEDKYFKTKKISMHFVSTIKRRRYGI